MLKECLGWPFYMVEAHVLVILIHAWDISLVHCVWMLWFISRGTYLWYWYIFEAYAWYMIFVFMVHTCIFLRHWHILDTWHMVWYKLWYMVDVHGMVMVLVSLWVDLVTIGWWWYIIDRYCDMESDKLDYFLIINYRLMRQSDSDRLMWKWQVGWCIIDNDSYRLINGSDNDYTLIFQGSGMGKGKGVIASFRLEPEKQGVGDFFKLETVK